MPLAPIADRLAKGKAQCGGDQEDRQHLHGVGQRGRILKRMGGVGIKETSSVGTHYFDRFLRGDRPHRQQLPGPLQRGEGLIRKQVLQYTLLHKQQGDNQRQRQQHPQGDAGQIDPGVAKRNDILAGEGAGQGEDHRNAAGCREEVLHRQPRHLAEIAQGGFTGIGLPVGVADKAHRGIQRQMP